ncbi:MAG: NFACT family protein [Chloroflexia bacterium]|nr:NFACT family protein [Chloroflexia bacterium]
MYFDALTMAAVASELEGALLGGRVQKVVQSAPLSIGLEIYAQGQRHNLLASAHPQLARVHLSQTRPTRDPLAQSPLLLLLRRRIRGARLQEIEAPPLERILRLHFNHPRLPLDEQYNILVVEVMGRHSNIILLDQDDLVVDCIKRVTPQMSPRRPMLPRQVYQPPPPQLKMDPRQARSASLQRALDQLDPGLPLWRTLLNVYQGLSPLLAREIVQRACGESERHLAQGCDLERLAQESTAFWADPASRSSYLTLEGQQPVAATPYRITHRPDWESQPQAGISQALERYFSTRQSLSGHRQTRDILQQALQEQRQRLQGQEHSLQEELAKTERIELLRRKGEWLLALQSQIRPDQALLQVEELDIEIDPHKSPLENAQSYFSAYRKAKLALGTVPARIQQVRQQLAWLDELDLLLEQAESHDEIAALAADLDEAGLLGQEKVPRRKKALPLRVFTTEDGFRLLAGRNARQNDRLLQQARPHDLWFHAQGRPGTHVIVVTEGRPVPAKTIEQAAALAAYYSRGRDEGRIAVVYTECRHVRRIPGAQPGQVRYEHERTVYIVPRPMETPQET